METELTGVSVSARTVRRLFTYLPEKNTISMSYRITHIYKHNIGTRFITDQQKSYNVLWISGVNRYTTMTTSKNLTNCLPAQHYICRSGTLASVDDCFEHNNRKNLEKMKTTHQSSFEFTSKENVDSIGVIASSAVCTHKLIMLHNKQIGIGIS